MVQAMAMQVIDNVEEEDDLSPLKAALDKARERVERLTHKREAQETDALEVAETAINERDRLDAVRACSCNTPVLHGELLCSAAPPYHMLIGICITAFSCWVCPGTCSSGLSTVATLAHW